ncbi:MAG TPA: hypothetical protein VE890_03725 [Thermoguttaceae bacterium]|nr:hypothetical protein [Thermoguttaceae bacterium]
MSKSTDRRQFLSRAVLGAAGAGAMLGREEQILAAALEDGTTETSQAEPIEAVEPMPCGKIGKFSISRMIMGGNLIGGWAHSRDLLYSSQLFKAYNTEAKIFETLELGERQGINTIQVDPAYQHVIEKYNKVRRRNLQSIVCVTQVGKKDAQRDQIKQLIDQGATMLYTHGMQADEQVKGGRIEALAEALDLIREQGLLAGIGSHSLEVPIAVEKEGLNPDYYVKTFHIDNYWSATPEEHREEWCWYKGQSTDHNTYHDNMFCLDAEKTAAFMEKVDKPWIAFKVLAAGAIHPRFGFSHAFKNGADFICVGMFDFHVAANAQLAKDLLRKIRTRQRPWRA